MAQFCVMVKGPCRGNLCDFWARIKIRKASVEELVTRIRESIIECKGQKPIEWDDAIQQYWLQMGIRNLDRLCDEEPDLCEKMTKAGSIARTLLHSQSHFKSHL